jgi:hypothetical protein
MGGGTQSKNISNTEISNIVNNNIINKNKFDASFETSVKNNSECKNNAKQKTSISFGEVGGDFVIRNSKIDQKITVSLNCLQKSNIQLNVINDLIKNSINDFKTSNQTDVNKIMESVAKSQSLSTSTADTYNSSNTVINNELNTKMENIIENSIRNNISLENSKKCITQIEQEAEIKANLVKGSVNIDNLSINQNINSFTECMNIDTMISNTQNQISEEFGMKQDNINNTTISEEQISIAETTGLFGNFPIFLIPIIVGIMMYMYGFNYILIFAIIILLIYLII